MKPSILLVDNYDSFTYNLADYIQRCGATCTVLRNDAPELDEALTKKWAGILLSPGPQTPQKAGRLMEIIHKTYLHTPILGVCLGLQALGIYFGATLTKAPSPRHGKTSVIAHNGHFLFHTIETQTEAMRYHSLIIELPEHSPLTVTARSLDDNLIMAIAHQNLPLVAVQFHPESVLTPQGLRLLQNWLNSLQK